jgi:hypothetical protein
MNDFNHKDIFQIAWKHFEVIANQRLTTFNFYVVLLAASIGATLTAMEHKAGTCILLFCGLFCIGAAITFLIVEIRTRRLLQIPKDVLTKLEKGDHWEEEYRLFSVDNLRQEGAFKKVISYSFAFRATMAIHILFGVVIIIMAFQPFFNTNSQDDQTSTKSQLELEESQHSPNNTPKIVQNQKLEPTVKTPVE